MTNTTRISFVVADASVAVVLEVDTLSLTLMLNRDDAVFVLSQLARAVLLVHGPTAVDEATKQVRLLAGEHTDPDTGAEGPAS